MDLYVYFVALLNFYRDTLVAHIHIQHVVKCFATVTYETPSKLIAPMVIIKPSLLLATLKEGNKSKANFYCQNLIIIH